MEYYNPNNHHTCTPVHSVPSPKIANKRYGIINEEVTRYINVILKCLKVFPFLWSFNDPVKSTLFFFFKSPIDPPFLLKSLKHAFIEVGHFFFFDLHVQQDVVEAFDIHLSDWPFYYC